MKRFLFAIAVALLPAAFVVGDYGQTPGDLPRYSDLPANKWVLIHREDAAPWSTTGFTTSVSR